MYVKIIVAALISLAMVSCGKSDENAEKAGAVNEASDTPVSIAEDGVVAAEAEKQTEASADTSVDQAASINTGESVYNRACAGCHVSGAAGAPKLGDRAAWADRIARGADALVRCSWYCDDGQGNMQFMF